MATMEKDRHDKLMAKYKRPPSKPMPKTKPTAGHHAIQGKDSSKTKK